MRGAVLMGLTAARLHRAIPHALAVGVVAPPRRQTPLQLTDRAARILLVQRRIETLDVVAMDTGRGGVLVTSPEQTVLDLAHRPGLCGAEPDALEIVGLWSRCDQATLETLAREQRLRAAFQRARRLVDAIP